MIQHCIRCLALLCFALYWSHTCTGILLAIPYGLMADRRGRRPTVCLSVPSYILNIVTTLVVLWFSDTIPLRAVWFSSLAWLIGGGPAVAFAVMWTMISDVTTEDER